MQCLIGLCRSFLQLSLLQSPNLGELSLDDVFLHTYLHLILGKQKLRQSVPRLEGKKSCYKTADMPFYVGISAIQSGGYL